MKKLKLILLLSLFGVVAHAQAPHYCDSVQAEFTSSAPECTGNTVDFANSGYSHPDCTYDWDFGANAIPATFSGELPPSVTYNLAGIKEASLTVTDVVTGCISYKNNGVQIYENPTVTFSASSMLVCEEETIDFTNTGSTGTEWIFTWDFGADATPAVSSAENPTGVYYLSSGAKTVTLNITNGNCIQSTSQVINVGETPVVDFASNAPICTGLDVDFTNLGSSTNCTFAWDFGIDATPGISSTEHPIGVVYSSDGAKIVSLTTTNTITGCSRNKVDGVLIRETPAASFTDSGDDCIGTDFAFTNTGTSGSQWNFTWDFGAGGIPQLSTTENPSGITYSTAGAKDITLTVNNAHCSNSITQSIDVFETPVCDFSSNAPVCDGLDVNFVNTGSTGGHTFAWDFGADATPATSTDENPSGVTYAVPGNKIVSLTTTDNLTGCTDQISQTITIDQTPLVSFTNSGDDCLGATFGFTNTGSTGSDWSYDWDFGESAIPEASSAENPTGIQYNTSGVKDILLTISNANCSNFIIQNLTVLETPEAEFAHTGPQCTGLDVDFTNTGTNIDVTFAWDFGVDATPATSTDENPTTITFATVGSHQVELVTTNTITGCTDNVIHTITINETPVADITTPGPTCLNFGFDFFNAGNTGEDWNYAWDFGDGANPPTSSAENPVGIMYDSYGKKYVSLTISNANCSNTVLDSTYVLETPSADFASTAPQCVGLPVNFTNTGDEVDVTFEWDFGTNSSPMTSTYEDPQNIVYDDFGTKIVNLVLTNQTTTCTDTIEQTITIHETPTASFSTNAPVCGDEGVDFTNTGSTGSNWSFAWDFGENSEPSSSTAQNPSQVNYTEGGTKSISLNVTDGVCSNSTTQDIEIFAYPEIDAGADTTICANASLLLGSEEIDGFSYEWFPSSLVDTVDIAQPIASPEAQVTNFMLTVTDAAGCMSKDSIIVTMLPSAIANAGPDGDMCFGDSIQIGTGLIEGQMYFWTPTEGVNDTLSPNPFASPIQTEIFTLNTFIPGCDTITDEVQVLIHQVPDVQATGTYSQDTVEMSQGEYVQLISNGAIQYEWTPEFSLDNSWIYNPIATPDSSTVYMVVGTDIYGCVGSDSVTVIVHTPGVFIPSAFTPNDDGKNDIFYIRGKGTISFELNIFNREGDFIYHSTNPDEGWDGTIQGTGKRVPNGAYVFHTIGEYSDGEKFNETGMINLIR